jgi:hypothetical protein
MIHEYIGAFDFRLNRSAVAEDRAPPKDHEFSGANRYDRNVRVVVADRKRVRSAFGDDDLAGSTCLPNQ